MKCNVGKGDKIVRIVLALIIFAVGFYYKSWWGLLGLVPLLTALMGCCLLYLPFKISSCKVDENEKQ